MLDSSPVARLAASFVARSAFAGQVFTGALEAAAPPANATFASARANVGAGVELLTCVGDRWRTSGAHGSEEDAP